MSSSTAAAERTIYLDMNVHKHSITIAVLPVGANMPTRLERDMCSPVIGLDRRAEDPWIGVLSMCQYYDLWQRRRRHG